MKHVAVIGDIEVLSDEDFVKVVVDGENALFIPRDEQYGLGELVEVLSNLIKKESK